MHEGKSLSSSVTGGDEVKMELDLSMGGRNGEVKDQQQLDLKLLKKTDIVQNGGILGGIGIRGGLGNSSSGGGSAGEDSSSDEPLVQLHPTRHPTHRHRHSLPPKKYRLKDSGTVSASHGLKLSSSPFVSFDAGSEDKEEDAGGGNMEDLNQDDDDCSQKDGLLQHSFTSGENSDSEMGGYGDGDESSKQEGDDAGKKIFECDVCNMKFSNGANMRRHRMRHTGVKPFECRVCQKRFFRKDHLAEHMATHSKLLPFRCPICNKGFQRQIAMRAHFQNAHVGGSHDIVKACPLCTYKSGSMKSLRGHFYSRHGIDLDNPLPHSPSIQSGTNSGSPSSPGMCLSGGGNGEYSELAHALGFEDRDKCNDSSLIPSHFLVPQIEISSNSLYSSPFPFTADSSYDLHDSRHHSNNEDSSSPKNVSPKSDSSSNIPSSSDLVVVKREILEVEEGSPEQSITSGSSGDEAKPKSMSVDLGNLQEGPEDLSSAGQLKSAFRLKLNSSSLIKISPLKSLLGEDWKKDGSASYSRLLGGPHSNSTNGKSSTPTSVRTGHSHSSNNGGHTGSEGEAITSSEGPMTLPGRRELPTQTSVHQCIYCKIVFPDITLYFLHKGCHSDSSPWRCNICGEACCNVYEFNSHLLSKSHQ